VKYFDNGFSADFPLRTKRVKFSINDYDSCPLIKRNCVKNRIINYPPNFVIDTSIDQLIEMKLRSICRMI